MSRIRFSSRGTKGYLDDFRALSLGLYHQGFTLEPTCGVFLESDQACSFVVVPERSTVQLIQESALVDRFSRDGVQAGCDLIAESVGLDELCDCENVELYVLDSSGSIPLMCGHCGGVVPLYRIPPTYDPDPSYYDLDCWKKRIETWVSLEFYSSFEELAQRELGAVDSDVNSEGRKLASRVQEVTGKPCYYFLRDLQDARDKKAALAKRCPGCQRAWLWEDPFLDYFEYRCDRCRLVGRIAANVRDSGIAD